MNQNERITNETLYPNYKDGQILQHTDVNKMIDVLKTGVNANYGDIKKMENGEKVVQNAASLNGLVATTFEDGTLDNDDEKLPTSKKVKQYVDNKVSEATPTKGVDYFTEAEIQGIKNDIESNINETMSTTINTAVTNGESAIDTYIANKEASANTSINNLASQKLDAITSASSTALSNISGAKDDALDSLDDALAEAESEFNSNASSKTSTFNTNATNRTTIYNDNASSKLSEYNTNSENKTTSFNDNYDEKLSAFNTNATNKTNAFDTNATNKTNSFDTVADRKIEILQSLIAAIPDDFGAFRFSVVQTLPQTGLSMTLYLLPIGTNNDNQNVYEEYIWLEDESRYEVLGTVRSSADIDLSQYATVSSIANVVRKTDYATNEQPGILKVGYSAELTQNGQLNAKARTYQEYQTLGDNHFISKKTLDNVLAGKGYDNDIASLKEDRDILVDLTTGNTTVSAEGKSITIDKRILSLKNFELLGDTKQVQLSGKNILNISTISNYGNITNVKNDDGTITTSGLPTGNYQVFCNIDITDKLENGKTYTISQSQPNNRIYLQVSENYKSNGSNHKIYYLAGQKSDIIQVDTTLYDYNVSIQTGVLSNWNNTSQSFTQYYQIEKGNVATDYEPYCGGVPSPNPSYPQTIQTATGSQEINVFGKNYFDKTNPNVKNIYIDSTNSKIGNLANARSIYVPCRPNTNYTVSKIATPRFIVGLTDVIPENNVTCLGIIRDDSATSLTITGNANAKYLVVFLTNAYDSNTWQNILDSIQIEEGNSATSYEKYSGYTKTISLGTIELNKIGDYQDRIYKQGNKWYLEKNVGKVVIDGSEENFGHGAILENTIRIRYSVEQIAKTNQQLCNRLVYKTIYNTDEEGFYISVNSNDLYIRLNKSLVGETKETIKAYMQQNNTIVYYILNNPVITEITDATLISQLNAIALDHSVKYITISSENTSATMHIDATANIIDILENKADKSELDSKQDKLTAGTNITIASDGTISATGGSTFSGDYNDLTNKPTLFSGSYNDLSNKPTIPDDLKDLTDDSTHRLVTDTEKQAWNNKSSFSGNYNDLSNKPTLFSGSYNDLSNKPTIPIVPNIVDNLTTNDATKTLSAKQGKILKDALDDKANADEVLMEQSDFVGAKKYLNADEIASMFYISKLNMTRVPYIIDDLNRS